MTSSWKAFWGAGASARTLEGPAVRSNWNRTAEPLRNSPVDLAGPLLRELGVTHLRVDLDWARIEPFPGRHDDAYLEGLDQRLTGLHEAGVVVWASLHDDALPGWFSDDTDGFATPRAPSIHWSRHVDAMAERFDHLVDAWVPFIDPIGWATRTAHLGSLPPFRQSPVDSDRFRNHVLGAVNAMSESHRLLASGSTTTVGAFSVPSVRGPETKRRFWNQLLVDSWIRAISDGVLEWPWQAGTERRDLADAFDAIALVVDAPYAIDERGALERSGPGQRVDELGRVHDDTRLDQTLHDLDERLDHPLVVMNVGIATADDQWRSACLERWLDQIAASIGDGVPVSGVFLEPFVDTAATDWGIVRRDGTPKPSYRWVEAQQ